MAPRATPRKNNVALVTGAARRIGREIALALAQDGWDIAVHYSASVADAGATVAEIERIGRRAIALKCDLAQERAARVLLARAARALGPVACLVNNASQFEFDEATAFNLPLFHRQMQVNAAAPIVLAQSLHAALPAMMQGVVINLLDQKLFNPNPDFLSYTLSKSALREATTLLAQALAPRVRVVGIAPGVTLPSTQQTPRGFARARKRTALGRSSTPADIAAAAVYLARAAAVTGTVLLVDGGQHLVPSARDAMFLTERR